MSDTSFYDAKLYEEQMNTALELGRPSVIWKVRVFPDGDKWIALYGENIRGRCGWFW